MKKRMNQSVFLLAFIGALSGCASTAKLYPTNDQASAIGLLEGTYTNYGIGSGKITVKMPSGETLSGEYSTVDTSTYGFGNVYASAYGSGGSAIGSATSSFAAVAGSSPGAASLFGDKGTSMECEYFVNNMTGKGAGACKTSSGALFKLHF